MLKKSIGVLAVTFFLVAHVSRAEQPPASALPDVKIDSIRFVSDLNVYEIVSDGKVFYMTKDNRYLILGNFIEIATRKNLTSERINDLRRIEFSSLNLSDAVKIATGNSGNAIAVFSDPDCPYCRKLHNELKKVQNTDIYVFLFPLESIHANSKIKSEWAWCEKDRPMALDAIFSGTKSGLPAAGCISPIERNIATAKKYGITGTPTIVLNSGKVVPGYVDAETITKMLHPVSQEIR